MGFRLGKLTKKRENYWKNNSADTKNLDENSQWYKLKWMSID